MNAESQAKVLATHTPALFESAVREGARLLRSGQVIAVPTETVYGLAANALDSDAVRTIFKVKGRPEHNPVIVHVGGFAMARECASEWPESAERLASAFWPGPLTLVVPRAGIIPDTVTAGGSTVGIRWPGHPFMQALIRECGFPLAAPSANPSNEVSPTRADHVRSRLGDRIPLIVDGGASQVGIESTVVDVTGGVARVLRPGMIHLEALRSVVEAVAGEEGQGLGPLRSPGRLARHYSPRARLRVARWANDAALRAELDRLGAEAEATHVIAHTHIPGGEGLGGVSVIPHDAEAFARALYAEWHRIDEIGARWIVVEDVPEGAGWRGIADRLRRAEGGGVR